jgi:hypothetical protein
MFITPVIVLIKLACLLKHMDNIPLLAKLISKHNKQFTDGVESNNFPMGLYQDIIFRMEMIEVYALLGLADLAKSELILVKKMVQRHLFEKLAWRARLSRGLEDEIGTLARLPLDMCYEITKLVYAVN